MKNMGNRLVVLFIGMAALWQFEIARPGSRHRSEGAKSDNPERGDVPGWVMITLMSAVLVAALLALAGPALEAMFNQAMDKVGN
jgi:type VI protein secretion system component VasF